MTSNQKRNTVTNRVKGREGKNQYTQGSKRTQWDKGFSDCSSLQDGAYKTVGVSIGSYTGAQIERGEWVTEGGAYPDESKLMIGDELFFAAYSYNGRPRNVGHIEIYVGNGQISGHGSGIGPTRKNMIAYCKQRNAGGGKYIGVKRYIKKDASDGVAAPVTTTPSPQRITNVISYQHWLNTYYATIAMRVIGATLVTDGIRGTLTRRVDLAVWKDLLNRQHKAGLTPTNDNFGASCKAAAAKYAVIKIGSSGTRVAIAQGILAGCGLYHGGIDASFSTLLEASVKGFQRKYGLKVDGIIGAETWFKLFNL